MGNKALEAAGNLFSYINRKCDCKITTTYDVNGNEQHSFWVKGMNNEEYLYAYAPGDGLVMIDKKTDKVIEKYKIINDLLSINLEDVNQIKCFIDKYGFFTKLPEDEYIEFNRFDLAVLLCRYQILVNLMAEIKKNIIDYNSVFCYVCILLFGKSSNITIPSINENIQSCLHPFTQLWVNAGDIEEINNLVEVEEDSPYYHYYPVEDTFTGNVEKMDYLTYNESVDNMGLNKDIEYSVKAMIRIKFIYLYKNAFPAALSARKVIDFFYHLLKGKAIMEFGKNYGEITIDRNITDIPKFKELFADKLILLAKQTIKEEFDYALSSIHPIYNLENMSPEWEIPNLYSALYFALFYTRPDYEVYRKCANPNCKMFFLVNTSNSKKFYHDHNCQNAAAQMRHRINKKKNN